MLHVRDLRKTYPGPVDVLAGVTLDLAAGDAVAVVGPSGSGKSTLLHVLGALDTPTAGAYALDGTDPFTLDPAGLAAFRGRRVGFVFQDHHLLPQLSVLENVLLPAMATGDRSPARVAAAGVLLERVGLGGRLTHRPAALSGGERQRAAVARALVMDPPLVLADEPTGNLDARTAAAVGDLLLELHAARRGVLVCVTHSADLAARFPRRLRMDAGRLADA